MIKSYKDYLTEAEQSLGPQPGDYLHLITEDSVYHIQLNEGAKDSFIKRYGKKAWNKIKKILGIGGAATLGAGLLGGSDASSNLFKVGYDASSNQFLGSNPLIETLNKQVPLEYPQNISHFVIDLR